MVEKGKIRNNWILNINSNNNERRNGQKNNKVEKKFYVKRKNIKHLLSTLTSITIFEFIFFFPSKKKFFVVNLEKQILKRDRLLKKALGIPMLLRKLTKPKVPIITVTKPETYRYECKQGTRNRIFTMMNHIQLW